MLHKIAVRFCKAYLVGLSHLVAMPELTYPNGKDALLDDSGMARDVSHGYFSLNKTWYFDIIIR